MNEKLSFKFVESLIKKTISSEILWQPLSEDMLINGERAAIVLGQCEFHMINFIDSYVCSLQGGYVFLVDERNESGRDSRFDTEGYNLYVQTPADEFPTSVMFDEAELYRLSNAIRAKSPLPQSAVKFMKLFIEE